MFFTFFSHTPNKPKHQSKRHMRKSNAPSKRNDNAANNTNSPAAKPDGRGSRPSGLFKRDAPSNNNNSKLELTERDDNSDADTELLSDESDNSILDDIFELEDLGSASDGDSDYDDIEQEFFNQIDARHASVNDLAQDLRERCKQQQQKYEQQLRQFEDLNETRAMLQQIESSKRPISSSLNRPAGLHGSTGGGNLGERDRERDGEKEELSSASKNILPNLPEMRCLEGAVHAESEFGNASEEESDQANRMGDGGSRKAQRRDSSSPCNNSVQCSDRHKEQESLRLPDGETREHSSMQESSSSSGVSQEVRPSTERIWKEVKGKKRKLFD